MSWEDKEAAMYVIRRIIPDENLSMKEKSQYILKLSLLDLTANETSEICEYIDGYNTDVNILCHGCRNNIKKSTVCGVIK